MLISSRHLLRRGKGTLFSLYLLLLAKANFPKRLLPTSDFFSLLKSSSKSSSSSSDPLVTWIEVKYVVLDTRTSVLKKLIGLSVRGTVWKFQDFSITQILREINFGGSRSANPAICAILGAMKLVNLGNFSLQKMQKFIKFKNQSL